MKITRTVQTEWTFLLSIGFCLETNDNDSLIILLFLLVS